MTQLFIYKISQSVNRGYDTYDSAVVIAESEDAARLISPCEYSSFGDPYNPWAGKPEDVIVERIGTAIDGLTPGVVVASFNAG